ncbi:MAG: hypothetical protein ACJAXX_001792 [Roseivirga sp.]|jgi:hypothetical protein
MITKRNIILNRSVIIYGFVFLAFTKVLAGQELDSTQVLLGEWKALSKEVSNGQNIDSLFDEKAVKEVRIFNMVLSQNRKGFDKIAEIDFEYRLKNGEILLDNRLYSIDFLNNHKLIITEIPRPTSLLVYRYYFIKVKR